MDVESLRNRKKTLKNRTELFGKAAHPPPPRSAEHLLSCTNGSVWNFQEKLHDSKSAQPIVVCDIPFESMNCLPCNGIRTISVSYVFTA